DISKLGSKWVNESSKNIAKAFGEIEKIANNSKKPVLVFMDELDSMLSRRGGTDSGGKEDNKVVNTLLQYIVRAKDNNIIIIGATNRYDALDGAVKDRVEQRAYMGLPDDDERKELILRHITKYKMCLDLARCDEDITFITKLLRPYSPRSIIAILKAASKEAYRDNKRPLCAGDVVLAIKKGNFEEINEAEYIPKKQKHSIGFCDTK
ncbi:ATP-binding protein, partial [bacterium]|nr:ATP-binding protein [bacterium]